MDFDADILGRYNTIIPATWVQWSLGIFLLSSPIRIEENNKIYCDADCYDGLQVLKDDKFDTRYAIASGADYYGSVIAIL